MPYCSKCGTQTSDNENFCPQCGNRVVADNSRSVAINTNSSLRFNNVRDEAEYLCDYFMQKENVYNAYIKTYREENNLRYPKKKWVYYPLWLIFMPGIEVLVLSFTSHEISLTIASIIALPLLFLWFLAKKKRYNSKCDALDKKTDDILSRRNAYMEELLDYYEAYGDCPIGVEYTYPDCVGIITDYIISRRADSFKEALYLYEQQQDVDEMKANLDQMASDIRAAKTRAGVAAHYAANTYYRS